MFFGYGDPASAGFSFAQTEEPTSAMITVLGSLRPERARIGIPLLGKRARPVAVPAERVGILGLARCRGPSGNWQI